VQALIAAGLSPADATIAEALRWLKQTQNEDGGFPYSWPVNEFTGEADPSDSSSTAWVAHAIAQAGQDPSSEQWKKNGLSPLDAIRSLQQENGGFAHSNVFTAETSFTPVATAYAVIALHKKGLPVHSMTPDGNNDGANGSDGNTATEETVAFRIEGASAVVCAGTLPYATTLHALAIIPKAAEQCGFQYEIQETSFGPYLKTIGNDTAEGLIGWLYRVNWIAPDIGAGDYALRAGDEVLWHYGDFTWTPLRLTASATIVGSGGNISLRVEEFKGGNWSHSPATIYGGTEPVASDAQGMAAMALPDGLWAFWAEAPGHIRSNRARVTVGSGNGQSVSLTVNVLSSAGGEGGGNQNGTLSMIVEPSVIAFGSLARGASGNRTLTVRNNGDVTAAITSTVHGDALFVDHLRLDHASWRSFNALLTASTSRNVNASLAVPSNSETGVRQGTLVFWAMGQ